ncbi:MAG: Coenzyme F420 hydrogenase/dehydrogenase, beta subunit C-terminal domain [Treponema sp.]|nr:Coenzyme F420 hydrogenase/dehydrogenase, beta subunit C-terminal domain [Treponema sp.]
MTFATKEYCTGCSACYSICPTNCIQMRPDNEGFLYPEIDMKKCTHCNVCTEICPVLNKKKYPPAFAVINNDEHIRSKSTSGGIFSVLAEAIIEQDGIVFGAKFDNDFVVVHGSVDTVEGIGVFRGSKYVQSVIGETFKECKYNLDNGTKVLFSGVPCQIGGLKAYLQKDYENLLCVDLICMSVPSPKVWRKYVEYKTKASGSRPKTIVFRDKNPHWQPSSMRIEFENNTVYTAASNKDYYLRTFFSEICTRKSCFHCNFRTLERQSDITIADFWGIEQICPEMYDNKGTSLVLLNSPKGNELFQNIKGKCRIKAVELEGAIKHNQRAIKSREVQHKQSMNKKRQNLFAYLDVLPFDRLVKRYIYDSVVTRGYRLIRICMGKIKRSIIK